jgi:outer membrane protein TolC
MKPIIKKFLLGSALLATTYLADAQNSPSTPPSYRPNVKSSETDIRERLVALALQNPNYEISDRNVNIANFQLKKAKGSWLQLFVATGNVNELSIKQGSTNVAEGGLYFPRYNFAVNLPFDFFSAKANDVKVARETLLKAEAEKNENYRRIRREVLAKYEDYLMHKEKLELQTRMTQAEYTRYKLAEKDFEDNLITAEVFNKSEATYFEQQIRKTELQRNLNVVKLELEEMIGVSFDDLVNKK